MSPMANCGVVPLDTDKGAFSTALYKIMPAPLTSVPMLKWVMVAVPLEHVGKAMRAALVKVLPDTVHPKADRGTACLTYAPYEVSLVVWLPPSPGSAVCRAMNKSPGTVLPTRPVASPKLAMVTLLKTNCSQAFSKAFDLLLAMSVTSGSVELWSSRDVVDGSNVCERYAGVRV